MNKNIKKSIEKIIASYRKNGIEIKEIWYESEVRVGFVVRYSINGTMKEMRIPGNEDVEEIIAPYKNKKGIVIRIETESSAITEVLPALFSKDDIKQISVGDADDVEKIKVRQS